MYDSTLYLKTKHVLEDIQNEAFLKDFYLAGGTALALQLGHRKSVDLDFFIPEFPLQSQLLQYLSAYQPVVTQQAEGTLDVYIKEVKVSFLAYQYPMIQPLVPYQHIRLAHVLDIACMKINAIASRGSKKDFVDLYFILQKYSLDEIFGLFEQKYTDVTYQKLHLLKSLVYFEDAESDPEPDYETPVSWNTVKDTIQAAVLNTDH